MKLITMIIKPFILEEVREALSSIGIQGLTVNEVKGFGRQKRQAELYRGAEYHWHFLPKIKVEIAITDREPDEVIEKVTDRQNRGWENFCIRFSPGHPDPYR